MNKEHTIFLKKDGIFFKFLYIYIRWHFFQILIHLIYKKAKGKGENTCDMHRRRTDSPSAHLSRSKYVLLWIVSPILLCTFTWRTTVRFTLHVLRQAVDFYLSARKVNVPFLIPISFLLFLLVFPQKENIDNEIIRNLHILFVLFALFSSASYTPLCSGSSTDNTVSSSQVTSCRFSIGESLTDRTESTTTFSSTTSLAQLLQEQGISAKAHNNPVLEKLPRLRPPKTLAVPSTPPNSPLHSPDISPLHFESLANVSDNFLASRPAETLLQDTYGQKSSNPPDVGQLKMNLVERLKKLGFARVVQPSYSGNSRKCQEAKIGLTRQDSAMYLSAGSNLMGGLRRNHSLPVLIGAIGGSVGICSSKMGALKEN